MGICYTVDSPIRVAPFGMTSVISLVDDGLLEEYRMAYAEREGVDVGAPEHERVGRIRAYLDFVADEIERRFAALQGLRIRGGLAPQFATGSAVGPNDKDRYFLMLPADSPLRKEYEQVCSKQGMARIGAEVELTSKMQMGEIQANIMVNLNHMDAALDAVHGFALSKIHGSLVLSAGINLGVFEEIARHECFYRREGVSGERSRAPTKKIILKVSDYRSALTQGRYLAKKGLEVYEYRIESGVNCGGHAFCMAKKLLPDVLKEFAANKQELFEMTRSAIEKFAEAEVAKNVNGGNRATGAESSAKRVDAETSAKRIEVKTSAKIVPPSTPARITVQGGICSAEEVEQVLALGADGVGVGTPFLLVPQATSCDRDTRRRLAAATSADVRLTHASPLGIPFMNLLTSTAAELCREKAERELFGFAGSAEKTSSMSIDNLNGAVLHNANARMQPLNREPGFPCKQRYLCREIPGFDHPLCMASREYVCHRLAEINAMESSGTCSHETAQELRRETLERECICRFLGNAGREELRERNPSLHYDNREVAAARTGNALKREPVTVCPGPNIAYFNREYTLLEMMQHLYGTGPQLTPFDKPHAFDLEREILGKIKSA